VANKEISVAIRARDYATAAIEKVRASIGSIKDQTINVRANTGAAQTAVQGVKDDVAKFKGYIEDGFDISDIGRSAMDVLVQLKNKFIELDGVGSLLAGGARGDDRQVRRH